MKEAKEIDIKIIDISEYETFYPKDFVDKFTARDFEWCLKNYPEYINDSMWLYQYLNQEDFWENELGISPSISEITLFKKYGYDFDSSSMAFCGDRGETTPLLFSLEYRDYTFLTGLISIGVNMNSMYKGELPYDALLWGHDESATHNIEEVVKFMEIIELHDVPRIINSRTYGSLYNKYESSDYIRDFFDNATIVNYMDSFDEI